MHEKHEKTNAMRQLDRKKAAYTVHSYDGGALSGTEVASALGQDPAHCFKTLVTVGRNAGSFIRRNFLYNSCRFSLLSAAFTLIIVSG